METFETHNLEETVEFGRQFARRLHKGDCVALTGPLGAGKTQFVRGVALGLGLADGRMVTSPTFVLMQEYPASIPVYHLDTYRLTHAAAELIEMGLEEMMPNGVVILEWAERASELLPPGTWQVEIRITGESSRQFLISRLP